MDLEDLLKGKSHHKHGPRGYDDHHKHYDEYRHDDHHYDRHGSHGRYHHGNYKLETLRTLYHSLPHKKALLVAALICILLAAIVVISLLWFLLPLAASLLGYVGATDIQGLLKSLLSLAPFLNG